MPSPGIVTAPTTEEQATHCNEKQEQEREEQAKQPESPGPIEGRIVVGARGQLALGRCDSIACCQTLGDAGVIDEGADADQTRNQDEPEQDPQDGIASHILYSFH